jgi:tetraacyldisaccharide 4'-kinase
MLQQIPQRVWYQGHWLGVGLAPLGWLYCGVAQLRRWLYQRGWLASYAVAAPVIVVGNLSVGGTGKTPLVLWLAGHLAARGHRPGIVLRGYGRRPEPRSRGTGAASWRPAQAQPRRVPRDADPLLFGDEAVLLSQRAGCPVMVGVDRVAAARALIETCDCDLVITDDGLQHYRLRRQLEILVVDAARGFGNRRCLPAGPLREPVSRRDSVDLCIETGDGNRQLAGNCGADSRGVAGAGAARVHRLHLEPGEAVNLLQPSRRRSLRDFVGEPVTAVAGIGHPARFFAMLQTFGLSILPRPYPDHHPFCAADARDWPEGSVLMTEKDAVKCRAFAGPNHWFLPVSAVPDAGFVAALEASLERRVL